jgi:hypothetical protein
MYAKKMGEHLVLSSRPTKNGVLLSQKRTGIVLHRAITESRRIVKEAGHTICFHPEGVIHIFS